MGYQGRSLKRERIQIPEALSGTNRLIEEIRTIEGTKTVSLGASQALRSSDTLIQGHLAFQRLTTIRGHLYDACFLEFSGVDHAACIEAHIHASHCPALQTAGQWRRWRRAELGLLGPRSSLTTPAFSKDLNGYGEDLLCNRPLRVKRIARQLLQTVKILRTLQPSREGKP